MQFLGFHEATTVAGIGGRLLLEAIRQFDKQFARGSTENARYAVLSNAYRRSLIEFAADAAQSLDGQRRTS